MIQGLLNKLNPANWGRQRKKKTIKLEVVASKMEEFQKQKKVLDNRIGQLEGKSDEMQDALKQTLDLTCDNQKRLDGIEDAMEKMIEMASKMVSPGGVGEEKGDSTEESEPKPAPTQQ